MRLPVCRNISVNTEHVMIADVNEHGLKVEEEIFDGGAELLGKSQGQSKTSGRFKTMK